MEKSNKDFKKTKKMKNEEIFEQYTGDFNFEKILKARERQTKLAYKRRDYEKKQKKKEEWEVYED